MSQLISLLSFYLRNPGQLAKHSAKAAVMLATQRHKELARNAAIVSDNVATAHADLSEHKRYQQEKERLLAQWAEVQEQNPREIIHLLSRFTEDLTVLDVVHGDQLQLRVIQCHLLRKYALFDEEFYRRRYMKDITSITPLDHYISLGMRAGNWPNAVFDPVEYLINNPDVATNGIDASLHYVLFGWRENRRVGTFFDPEFYLRTNPDVASADMCPLHHYLAYGRSERRLPIDDGTLRIQAPKPEIVGKSEEEPALSRDRGTILVVSHDAELGGAQKIVEVYARWLLNSTQYDVRILCMKGGPLVDQLGEIAPLFNFDGYEKALGTDGAIDAMRKWAGPDVKVAFVNSVASGRFFEVWGDAIPAVSYLHELPKIIEHYGDNVHQIIKSSHKTLGGSYAVRDALVSQYDLPEDRSGVVYDFVEAFSDDILINFSDKPSAKAELGLDPEAVVMMGCGVAHWRKAPDKFIDVAKTVVANSEKPVQFVWIGDGEDFDDCVKAVNKAGLTDLIKFVGYQKDLNNWLRACDVFLLTSVEDPFPLVCLYGAMSLAPVVCFQDAGGMPEFVAQGCGEAAPFLDVDAMADIVLDYVRDEPKRQRHGTTGRAIAQADFTVRTTGPQLLHYLREAADLKPALSVVVPNYNYERHLPERLDSILDQTYQDFELILLDDLSPDNSVDVLNAYAARRPGTRVVVNEVNSGSPFKQWIKGIRMANADLVWMAEADDFCENNLVETLIPYMADRNVFLSYVKSVPVNSDGQIMGDYEPLYLNRINEGRWSRSYVCTDHEELNEGIGIANSIPNASSVIMRKFEPDEWFENTVSNMRLCGDWFFYIRAIRSGSIAYSKRPLNYHRRHDKTVTHQLEGSLKYFDELAVVRKYVADNYEIRDAALDQIETFVQGDLDRFQIQDEQTRQSILSKAVLRNGMKAMPTLAVVTPDLSPGGGQVFAFGLANAWIARGGRAMLVNVRNMPDHPAVMERISPRLSLYHVDELKQPFDVLLREFDVDVVHSSIWWSDRFVHDHIPDIDDHVPWIVSMHGCAESIIENPDIDRSFPERIPNMLERVDAWAYTAEKNRQVFDIYGAPKILQKVDNGFQSSPVAHLSREKLGVREDAVLLCLATRAIESKGWFHAVEMVKLLNNRGLKTDLMLIGEGEAADRIRKANPPHVHLYGQVGNLQDYIAASDIGILPSYFVGESMPLVLLEMMSHGKPVIATDVGEIPHMIAEGGLVVPLVNDKPDVAAFVSAIAELADPLKRAEAGRRAKEAFEARFTMDRMLDRFHLIYDQAIAERTGQGIGFLAAETEALCLH